jgi:ABC-type amino acid transport substrate-binding protein
MVNQVIAQDTAKSVSEPDSPLSKIILTSEEEAWLKEHPEITIAPLEDPTLSEFRLTEKEQEWIKNNPIVRVRVGSAPPLHFFEDGQYKGISIDYMDLIAERVGFQVKYVTDIPWPVALENIRNHEDIDLLLTAKIDQEREEYMAFTDIYLSMPLVIFNQTDTEYIENINDLNGKTVSVERGYIIQEKLENEFPEINLLITDTSKEAIEAVSFGIADAYIGNLSIATYIIQQNYLSNLKIAAPTPLDNHDQAMGIRNDWPELASIINKTLRNC